MYFKFNFIIIAHVFLQVIFFKPILKLFSLRFGVCTRLLATVNDITVYNVINNFLVLICNGNNTGKWSGNKVQ